MPDEVIKLRRKITNYTNQNGQGCRLAFHVDI